MKFSSNRDRSGQYNAFQGLLPRGNLLSRTHVTSTNLSQHKFTALKRPKSSGSGCNTTENIKSLPLKISIAESREELINETDNATEDIQIFSDGSALEGMVGAAAILTHQGRRIRTLHYHLGPDTKHTVHEAEMVGLLLGLHMLNSMKYRSLLAMIGIDN